LASVASEPGECWGGVVQGGVGGKVQFQTQLFLILLGKRLAIEHMFDRIGASNSGIQQSSARSAAGWPLKPVDLEFGEVVIEFVEDHIQPAALRALLCCWIPEFHTPYSIQTRVR